jgi:tetratricopeptide (TPR) repeat protein
VAIEENLAEAQTVLAYLKYMHDWDWDLAELEFRKAIELNPNSATTHQWYSEYLKAVGRPDEAVTEINRAVGLDPLSLIAQTIRGVILYDVGRAEEGLDQLRVVLDLDPNYWPALRHLTAYCFLEGMENEAVDTMEKYLAASGANEEEIDEMNSVYQDSGMTGVNLWLAERLAGRSGEKYVNPRLIAIWFALIGDDRAYEWLELAYEERAGGMPWIKDDMRFVKVRSDSRFIAIVEKMGLKR